jgi:hypothetical protein
VVGSDWSRIDRDWRNSKRAILAYHVGEWRKGESPLAALARALGFASEDIALELIDYTFEHDQLEHLSTCLGSGWVDVPGLDIEKSVDLAISLISEKLEEVPPEVREFFGAPRKLEPFLTNRLYHQACA